MAREPRRSRLLIACICDAGLRDALGFTERAAGAHDDRLMFFHPGFPRRDAFLFLGLSFGLGKRHPFLQARIVFAADKDGEIGVIRAHGYAFPG